MDHTPERVGLVVIRAWIEVDAAPSGLRARLTAIDRLTERHEQRYESAFADVDVICDEVRRWLDRFVSVPAHGITG